MWRLILLTHAQRDGSWEEFLVLPSVDGRLSLSRHVLRAHTLRNEEAVIPSYLACSGGWAAPKALQPTVAGRFKAPCNELY